MNRIAPLIVSLAALATAASAAPQFYSLGAGANPTSISANGVVAGTHDFTGQYFYWTPGDGFTFIGGVLPNDGYGGQATISSDGMRIGGTNINNVTNRGEMAFYDRNTGAWTNLGGIGGFSDFSTSSGWGISGDGQHMVGLGWVNGGTAHAIRWSQGTGTSDMGSTVPGNSTRANTTNHDGSVVGGWQDDEFGRSGVVWVNGVQKTMVDADGFQVSEVLSLSADGQWATGVTYGNDRTYRYNTTTDTLEYIDPVDGFFFNPTGLGTGITDDGRTIIGSVRDFGPPIFGTGFIWREGVGTMTINEYFDSVGVAYEADFLFSMPFAISGDGLTLAGIGLSPSEGVIGWVVVVPSPGAASVLGLGAIAGLRRRR